MSASSNDLAEKFQDLAGKWTGYAAFGTFLLYLFGYLALRFQLSTYGVATDLDVFDEKYVFAGSRFLVYLVSSVPNVLLIGIVVWTIGYLPYRLTPRTLRQRLTAQAKGWAAQPSRVPLLGTVVALALIQFVLRKCFVLGNLLLAKRLPDYEWIGVVLLTSDGYRALYFSGILAGTILTAVLLLAATRSGAASTLLSRALVGLLIFLVGVEFLLLPVNYGILIASQQLPRVSEVGGDEPSQPGNEAWLVWENKEVLTYLIRRPGDRRSLLTMPRKDSKITIVAYDDIFPVLFVPQQTAPQPVSREKP